MKTDTSMNLMLVVFCMVMIGFVFFSKKLSDKIQEKQYRLENKSLR
jgi:D-alanyl-lipoteichoic acid acyltransferase DltB (MBOAT superfamily)